MDENITQISWEDLLALQSSDADWGKTFHYNTTDRPRIPVRTAVLERLEMLKEVEKAVTAAMSGDEPLYFKVTAGSKAGSIMRLVNPEVFKRYDSHERYRGMKWSKAPPPLTKTTLVDRSSQYGGSGSFDIDGHYYVPSEADMKFEIDGVKGTTIFSRRSSTNKTMKCELLLGYKGPTLLQKGKPTKKSMTIKDRYGREVGVGDVVLMGSAGTGRLLAGKITRISDARGVWIKHIGAKEDFHEKACSDDQLMLLKDIEQALMMEKLKQL